VTAALLAVGLAAQGAEVAARMRPAPELRKLEPMVGSYQGSGTMLPSAGAKPLAWTARTNVRWALGGFALHEEATIEFADGSVPPLHDRDGKRYVMVSASRMGVQMRPCWILANPAAADGDSDCCPIFVSTSSGTMDGEPYVDHDVTRFGTDSYDGQGRTVRARPRHVQAQQGRHRGGATQGRQRGRLARDGQARSADRDLAGDRLDDHAAGASGDAHRGDRDLQLRLRRQRALLARRG
jgi:hypothetical protein